MGADLVAHCGGSMAGSVVHTLVLTDVAKGWTECVPLIARDQALIVEALEQVSNFGKNTLDTSLRIKSGLCGVELGSGGRTWRSA